METKFWIELAALLVLLVLSAFFSGSETAYFSLNESRLRKLSGKKGRGSERVVKLLGSPRRLLITIITGNTIVNVSIATIAVILALDIGERLGIGRNTSIWAEVIVVTIVILIFAEMAPKIAAVRRPERLARFFSLPLMGIYRLLSPIARLIYRFTGLITNLLGFKRGSISLDEREIRTLVDIGEEKGTLEEDERELLHGIFELGDTTVRKIMVPRTDLKIIPLDAGIEGALKTVRESRLSRIPVYGDGIDDIKGILFAKDLTPYIGTDPPTAPLRKLLHQPFFVPESMKIDDLLVEFQEKRRKSALVVDEYGGISGLVTLEDVLEEIFGEIQDEHDDEQPIFRRVGESRIIADARWDLDDAEDEIGISFPKDEGFDSLGGFLFHLFGDIPEEGEKKAYSGVEFTVKKIEGQRITTVEIDVSGRVREEGGMGKEEGE